MYFNKHSEITINAFIRTKSKTYILIIQLLIHLLDIQI